MRTTQQLIGNALKAGVLAGPNYVKAAAIDDVLDIVRVLLYKATSHSAEMALIDSLREPMGRVDSD